MAPSWETRARALPSRRTALGLRSLGLRGLALEALEGGLGGGGTGRSDVVLLSHVPHGKAEVNIQQASKLNNTFRDDPDLRYLDGDVFDDDTELDEVHVYLKHGVPVRGKKKAQRDPVQGLIPPADVIDDVLDESAEYSYPKSKKDKKSKKSKSETRKKRSITVDPSNYWPNGIVPYVYDDTMTEDLKKSFYFASELIEKYTCVRFVPWDNETRTSYGIDHDNYLLFMGDSLSSGTLEHFFLATRTYQYKENLLQGELSSGRAEHHFCVRTSHGYIQFDNKPSSGTEYVSTWSGTLPDGTYGEDTRWEFCCRDDSVLSVPMDLPNDQPLALWRNSYYGCQPIKGMNSESHMMVLKNDVTGLAELSPSGTRPLTWKYASGNMYISYCYYYPIQTGSEGCGGVITLTSTERSATFTSPGYPANYENKLHCVWTIEGPPDSSILLTFSDFDVEGTPNNCEDEVEVNHALIGQNGISYCGQEMYGTIRSVTNKMSVKLITGLFGQTGGFNATVTLALPEEHCFNPADRGASYRGTVSFTRDFQTCLPWSEVTHCPHHPYKHGDYYDGLDGNYCRNPGDGLRPWCYTNATFCQRNYCDVCQLENAYDTEDAAFCQDLLVNGSCSDHAVARQYCSRTCADLLPAVDIPTIPYTDNKCQPPTTPPDGVLVGTPKTEYDLGEQVTFACEHPGLPETYTYDDYYDYAYYQDCVNNGDCSKHQTLEATCLSDGTWTPMGYVCGACLDGWHAFQETCYKVHYEQLSYSDASTKCSNDYEGDLAEAQDDSTNTFLLDLRNDGVDQWIGLTLDEQTSQWVWQDGSVAQWTNWRTGEPGNYKCASADEYGEWSDVYCANSIGDWERAFTCRRPAEPRTVCKDRITDCAAILTSYPNVCDDYPDFAYVMCPRTCALCSDAVPPECPENWTEFEEACYKFNSTTASYANAVSACAAEGAVLSPAKSQNEFFFVFQQLGSASAMWLGANDIATEGTWLWEDGTAIDFNKWKTGDSEDVGEKLAEDVVSEACGQTDDNKDDEDEKDQEEDESVRQKEEETLSEEEKEDRKQRGQKLKEEGNQLFRQASYAEAITCYTQALEICPLTYQKDRAIMFSNRAACRMKEEKYETAIKDCSKAIDLHPHYLKAVLRRAELYEKTEKLDDAMKDHQKVLELDPSQHASRAACLRLDEEIKERNEKLKNEMIGKLKDLGNMVLRPFGLSTNNFKLQQDPSTGGYSVQFCQDPPTNGN
nr:hypothetical protein BaRGS_017668 [Batillaria attramentaria]